MRPYWQNAWKIGPKVHIISMKTIPIKNQFLWMRIEQIGHARVWCICACSRESDKALYTANRSFVHWKMYTAFETSVAIATNTSRFDTMENWNIQRKSQTSCVLVIKYRTSVYRIFTFISELLFEHKSIFWAGVLAFTMYMWQFSWMNFHFPLVVLSFCAWVVDIFRISSNLGR